MSQLAIITAFRAALARFSEEANVPVFPENYSGETSDIPLFGRYSVISAPTQTMGFDGHKQESGYLMLRLFCERDTDGQPVLELEGMLEKHLAYQHIGEDVWTDHPNMGEPLLDAAPNSSLVMMIYQVPYRRTE